MNFHLEILRVNCITKNSTVFQNAVITMLTETKMIKKKKRNKKKKELG